MYARKQHNTDRIQLKANGTRRVTVSDFKGQTLVSIREYYEDKESGQMKPGKKVGLLGRGGGCELTPAGHLVADRPVQRATRRRTAS
jgi:hypothetical protein